MPPKEQKEEKEPIRERVLIHGEWVVLEKRVCAGGCGKSFKCRPESNARTAMANCARICKGDHSGEGSWADTYDFDRDWSTD